MARFFAAPLAMRLPARRCVSALHSSPAMAYSPRIQRDQHTLTFACWCGATSRHKMVPGRYRISCPSCHRRAIVGNAVMRVELGAVAAQRPPSDLAIPRPHLRPHGGADSPLLVAEPSEETTIDAGKWHSAEPITLDMPRHDAALPERWRDRRDGSVWLALPIAMGTRMLCAKSADPTDRVTVSRREWLAAMERVDDGEL